MIVISIFHQCSTDDVDALLKDERIDIEFSGALDFFIQSEASDLISYPVIAEAIYNKEEKRMELDLGDNGVLRFSIYNHFISEPLFYDIAYPAYTMDFLFGRGAYVVAEYELNGEVLFSTTSDLMEQVEQINVFQIRPEDDQYRIFLENLTLYSTDSAEKNGSEEVEEVELNGVFFMNYIPS